MKKRMLATYGESADFTKRKSCAWGMGIVLASACFQDLQIVDFGSFALKPFHIVTVFVLLISIAAEKGEWRLPSPLFLAGLACGLVISLVDYLSFGFNSMILNYIFMYLIAACMYNLGIDIAFDGWKRITQSVSFFVIAAVYIKLALNWQSIRIFLSDPWAGHPVIPTFLGGGVNLEASWLALFIVFFDSDRRGAIYMLLATLLSMVYASRAGLIICVLSFIYVFVYEKGKRGLSLRLVASLVVILTVFIVLAAQGNILAERFLSSGEDRGSQGRLNMWQYALPTFLDSPLLGNGAGNATRHMSLVGQTDSILENNVHMYFLQVLLDFGLVGFSIFLVMIIYFIWKCWKSRLSSPFEAYILIYLIVSFVQFRGGDVLLGAVLGGLFLTWDRQKNLLKSPAKGFKSEA